MAQLHTLPEQLEFRVGARAVTPQRSVAHGTGIPLTPTKMHISSAILDKGEAGRARDNALDTLYCMVTN